MYILIELLGEKIIPTTDFVISGTMLEQDIKREKWILTEEGQAYANSGSPEVQFFLAIPPKGISREELQVWNLTLILIYYYNKLKAHATEPSSITII